LIDFLDKNVQTIKNKMYMKNLAFFKRAAAIVLFAAVGFAPKAWATEHVWNGDGSLLTTIAKNDVVTIEQGATGTLIVPPNVTITIDGEVAEGNPITIFISAKSQVDWEATYSSSATEISLVTITGEGSFEVAGGSVSATGKGSTAITATGNNSVTVSAGMVTAAGNNGYAINVQNGNVTIEGGVINAAGYPGMAIYAGGEIAIEGGVVMAQNAAFIDEAGVLNKMPVGDVSGMIMRQDPKSGVTVIATTTEGAEVPATATGGSVQMEFLR